MNSHPDPNTILDRHEKAVADILKRFLNMVVAATEPIDEGYTPEKASLNQMQMETETAALVSLFITPSFTCPSPAVPNLCFGPTSNPLAHPTCSTTANTSTVTPSHLQSFNHPERFHSLTIGPSFRPKTGQSHREPPRHHARDPPPLAHRPPRLRRHRRPAGQGARRRHRRQDGAHLRPLQPVDHAARGEAARGPPPPRREAQARARAAARKRHQQCYDWS